jgi:hypothetical protein
LWPLAVWLECRVAPRLGLRLRARLRGLRLERDCRTWNVTAIVSFSGAAPSAARNASRAVA